MAAQTVCPKTQETGYGCILWHIKDMGPKTQYSCYKREPEPLSSAGCGSTRQPSLLLWAITVKAGPSTLKSKAPVADREKNSETKLCVNTTQSYFSSRFFPLFSLTSPAPHGDHEFFLDTKWKLPQKINSMVFSYKWGHIKWQLLPFLWKNLSPLYIVSPLYSFLDINYCKSVCFLASYIWSLNLHIPMI